MTINNPTLYSEAWDWAILDGCFGDSNIKPTDIDGVTNGEDGVVTVQGLVEHHDNFLWLEAKRPGVDIPLGQKITLEKTSARGDCVIFIWGQKNMPEKLMMLWRGKTYIYDPANLDKLREIVSRWYRFVHNNRMVTP